MYNERYLPLTSHPNPHPPSIQAKAVTSFSYVHRLFLAGYTHVHLAQSWACDGVEGLSVHLHSVDPPNQTSHAILFYYYPLGQSAAPQSCLSALSK